MHLTFSDGQVISAKVKDPRTTGEWKQWACTIIAIFLNVDVRCGLVTMILDFVL